MRRVLREVLVRYRVAVESMSRIRVPRQHLRFLFPVPQVQISMLVHLSRYEDRHLAEDHIKRIFDFFLKKDMYVFGADAFDFLPVIHRDQPLMYVRDFVVFPIVTLHMPRHGLP